MDFCRFVRETRATKAQATDSLRRFCNNGFCKYTNLLQNLTPCFIKYCFFFFLNFLKAFLTMMMMSSSGARNYMTSSPFTATQFQELEHQALIFKYMVSGVPIPPDLIYTLKRSLDSTRLSFPHQPIGWGCFQMGFGRKIDPEPGRCRRTDGKKWRCSKEAYPDSKYCERHMHRGRNRSRKPVENHNTTINDSSKTPSIIPTTTTTNPNTFFINSPPTNTNTKNLFFNSGSSSHTRCVHGIDEQALFPEASGSVRSLPAANDSTMNHYKGFGQFQEVTHYPKKHHHQEQDDDDQQHCFVLGTDFKSAMRPIKLEKENHESQKPLHHFFGEWTPKNSDSWLDLASNSGLHPDG